MVKMVFDLKNSKKIFFRVRKEQILFQVKPLKMSNKIFVVADFRPFLRILGVF